jgi:hypothetical protein
MPAFEEGADASPRTAADDAPRPVRRPFAASHLRTAVGAALGAGLGAAYAYLVGCRTGTCPLTSSIWTAALYGSAVGGLAGWPSRHR